MEHSNLQQLPWQNDDREEKETVSSEGETSMHKVLDISGSTTNLEPQSCSFVFSFRNLSYIVKLRQKFFFQLLFFRTAEPVTKTILKDIFGKACDGQILALLGASHSGKTTLLDALANRIAQESLRGTVDLNGEVLESGRWNSISTYVMQDDLLFPMLTVEETLAFAVEFRLPRSFGASNKKVRVQWLIDQLGLQAAAKTIIGDEGHRGVSGGERRRVSIGINTVHGPILLFLGETTSGLDAFMMVKILKNIAQSGSIVVMSVHNHGYRIISLLDKLIFLSRGQIVYRGMPSNLPMFCSEFRQPIPDNTNVIEFMLDLISELECSTNRINVLVELANTWKSSELTEKKESNAVLSSTESFNFGISKGKEVSTNINIFNIKKTFANPFWSEILVPFKRSMTNLRRTPKILIPILTTGFLLGTIYWQLDESSKGVKERLGFCAFAMSATYFPSCQYLADFLQERFIFARETAYKAYCRSTYLPSLTLAVLFTLFVQLSMATFWAVGLAGGATGFLVFFLIIYRSFWVGNSFAMFLCGLVPHILLGYTAVISVSAYFLLLSGFFIDRNRIPSFLDLASLRLSYQISI